MFSDVSDAQPYLILFLVLFLGVWACVAWFQPRAVFTMARWSVFVPHATETPDGFYARLYTELQSRLEQKQLPFSSVGFGPKHMFSTRTIFGSRPVYLAVKYQHLTYYIYVAPAPNGLFVSSWLFSKYASWEDHPLLRMLLFWRLYQLTLFQFDVMELFHGVTHDTLADVIDSYRAEEGLHPMAEYERRPILNSYYSRLKQGAFPANGGVPGPVPSTPGTAGNGTVGSGTGGNSGVLPIQTAAVRSPEEDLGHPGHFSPTAT